MDNTDAHLGRTSIEEHKTLRTRNKTQPSNSGDVKRSNELEGGHFSQNKIMTSNKRNQDNKAQPPNSFADNKNQNKEQGQRWFSTRIQNQILATAQQNIHCSNTDKGNTEVANHRAPRRRKKTQQVLNDRDDQISLWRVPDRSNVFTVIGASNNGFAPLSYSDVVAGRVTRNSGQTASYPDFHGPENIPQLLDKQTSTKTVSKPDSGKQEIPPPLPPVIEAEPSAKNIKKDNRWIKVTKTKKKKSKNIETPEDTPIIYPELKNNMLNVEMSIKMASQIVPEIRANKSRMKIKRDVRKMRAKKRRQEHKTEMLTKTAKDQAKGTYVKPETRDRPAKLKPVKAPLNKDQDNLNHKSDDYNKEHVNEASKTASIKKTRKKKKNKKATTKNLNKNDSATEPVKIKSVKEAVSVGRGKKPKKDKRNKKPKSPSEDLEQLPALQNIPDKHKAAQNPNKFMRGKTFKWLDKDKKETKSRKERKEEPKHSFNEEIQGGQRKLRSGKVEKTSKWSRHKNAKTKVSM